MFCQAKSTIIVWTDFKLSLIPDVKFSSHKNPPREHRYALRRWISEQS